jgi:hypothetical protein
MDPEDRTELANSRRYVERYSGDIRHIPEWGKFIHYDFGYWAIEESATFSLSSCMHRDR